MSDIRIRLASAADAPALVDLMEAFYAESHYPLDRDWALQAFRTLISQPALGAVWVADNGALIGHAVLTVRYAMEFGALSAIIDDLFVSAPHRQRGIARRLLEALLEDSRSRGCKSVHVEVGASNPAARQLYASLGLLPYDDDRLTLHREFD
ncbi:GNAT family N-acetyltransferase [Massilia endophytica]|uniref:GNAT family N-acetyltransferase n=1 Tax=Massilia endophytica TaxID=2899220 RepID=UPI001E461C13|nr:GNAT family N-acetyltransferase [Massilia endophytica]UGQ45508.1 GNAT family N-acetyltransferase [Massilia endophytica]